MFHLIEFNNVILRDTVGVTQKCGQSRLWHAHNRHMHKMTGQDTLFDWTYIN